MKYHFTIKRAVKVTYQNAGKIIVQVFSSTTETAQWDNVYSSSIAKRCNKSAQEKANPDTTGRIGEYKTKTRFLGSKWEWAEPGDKSEWKWADTNHKKFGGG